MGIDRASIDVDLTAQEIAGLTSVDALVAFMQRLGYDTGKRSGLSPESIGLNDTDKAFRTTELLSEDPEGFLRVVFAQVRSLTVKARTDLVRSLSRFNQDHLIVMTSDFQVLELVLIDKVKRRQQSPATVAAYKPVPRVYAIQRKAPNRLDLRILRRLTFTQRDGLEQFDKLRSVFQAAAYTSEHYQNRALFADHYLDTRLREDVVWAESPNVAFAAVKGCAANAREQFGHSDESATRRGLIEPLFDALGFKYEAGKDTKNAAPTPDYLLRDADGKPLTVALVYQWDRWLDGSDPADQHSPDENPGASVVSVLEQGQADWAVVTNGKLWRLYSRRTHSRSTNFYEVDLEEILSASAETDPGEAFRYWWLFFRAQAFRPLGTEQAEIRCWLDTVVAGSRDYAKQVEERLKKRVFEHIVPHLAMGFLSDRRTRLGVSKRPSDEELEEIREGALTLLYRLLFLLYAESRDLLPVRESAYYAASFRRLKQEVADAAGPSETDVDEKLASAYRKDRTSLYDRLQHLFEAMDAGDPVLNVPTYNGGLFLTKPDKADDSREAGISRFLRSNKIPDLFLAQAIDHLSRDPDERSFGLVFIDYKSLGVRQLGSIYEGLLEFKLKIADEDMTTVKEKDREKVIALSDVQGKRKKAEVAIRKGEVYLANDKSERRASGSYYTPDHIVEYIVENTVGPVLARKLEDLRSEFRAMEKTYQRHMDNLRAAPGLLPGKWTNKAEFEIAAKAEASARTYASHSDLVERFFDMKVLDPAMGSGHFLVQAVDFITDKLLDFLNGFPRNPVSTALERTRQSILESLIEQAISVDPDRLTDVHLLKRHVLKRCIYGVDLNPMAVELAKVSLWLDAFTLGAPLSFLDHHLRYGNSLIGATFEDLEKATAGQLFAINYEPMYRAINNVLTVARLADATAAEVHHSVDAYASVRKALSGYQVILNILTARYFGADKAVTLLTHAHELDLSSEEKFLASLQPADRKMISQVEDVAQQRSFFHWELEFPEIFFGPHPGAERQVQRKPIDRAGFDAVIGNPPYDELSEYAAGRELPEMAYFREEPLYNDALGGRLNLFRLFIVRAVALIATPGRQGFIIPMSLLADKFTLSTRRRIVLDGLVREVAAFPQKDDPHRRVFFDAKLSTCIAISEKPGREDERIHIRTFPGRIFSTSYKECHLTVGEIKALDPEMLSLPAISATDVEKWRRINAQRRVTKWRDAAKCYLGELMTNASNAHLVSDKPVGPRLLRGANINFYVLLDEPKQGEPLYLRERQFLKEYRNDIRSTHNKAMRVGFQESCPMDNWRRLISCIIPPGHYCVHKIRYFAPDAKYDLYAIMAMFNSRMADWRFSLTSTNNSLSAYEIDALPIPRFGRLSPESGHPAPVDWKTWDRVLGEDGRAGIDGWEDTVRDRMKSTPSQLDSWPDSIHDALAAAGKEMSRLGEERQHLTNEFSDWLGDKLQMDAERFSGTTHIRGGQADFDRMGWEVFSDMLMRNRRACGVEPTTAVSQIRKKYESVAEALTANRERFSALGAAIDRVVWQLVGLDPDGNLRDA